MNADRIIGNVGVLDLRRATPDSVKGIARIHSVGTLVFSRETASLLSLIDLRYVGSTREISSDVDLQVINGQVVFNKDFFESRSRPAYLLLNGHVRVSPDVETGDIEAGLTGLLLNGHILCPDHLVGAVHSKIVEMNGHLLGYPPESRLAMSRITLDESFLEALADGSTLTVAGRLSVPRVISNDLIRLKLASLRLTGRLRCHEENAATLLGLLSDEAGQVTTHVIRAGFELVESSLMIDQTFLISQPPRKIYCMDLVQVDAGVGGADLDGAIDTLATEDLLVCPASLRDVVARKCNPLETRAIYHEGPLWLVDGEATLTSSRLDYLKVGTTLVVTGELAIDADVDPARLYEGFDRVHNLGEISCNADQRAALEARLGIGDGESTDPSDARPVGEHIGYLTL